MGALRTSAFESDKLLLSDDDLNALRQGKTLKIGSIEVSRLPSPCLYGPDIYARLDEAEWAQRPDLW